MEKEICICSAVEWNGKVWRGHRHNDCIRVQEDELSYTMTRKEMCEKNVSKNQGFITSKNRFVDRKEGCKLQQEANISSRLTDYPFHRGELYSEDLY